MTDGNGQLPVWQPGDPVPAWAAKLQEPFPSSEIGVRPQLTCGDCSKAQTRYCGQTKWDIEHVPVKCPVCKQTVSRAHMHLYYVGHADATGRLLDADPWWTWRPMARDIDPEVLKAAIATGNLAIIQTVIASFPPKMTELEVETKQGTRIERGMWIELIIHDDQGNEVITPGYGDAIGKAWGPNALKEIIGDGIRNAGQRRGIALDLWRKIDLEQARRETAQALPESATSLAASLFGEGNQDQAGEGNQDQPAKGRAARKTRETPADTGNAGINPEAQAAADLAWQLAATPGGMGKLQAAHEEARKKRVLGLHCLDPARPEAKITVLKVFARAREALEALDVSAAG